MKTTLAVAGLTLLFAATSARADHRVYRDLDDLVFEAMHDARDARWEIHDHFDTSRDYRPLLEGVDEVMHALRDIQDGVYREADPRSLTRLIDHAHEASLHLREHAERSDFASYDRGSYRSHGRGYRYRAPTRHAGYVHVRELIAILDRVDARLHEMEREIDHAFGRHRHDSSSDHRGSTGPHVDDEHRDPPPPALVPPGRSAGRSIGFPLLGDSSGLVFRLRID